MGDYYTPPPVPRDADGATASLVCGILGIACCGILAPIAWVLGEKALAQIRETDEPLGGQQNATVGRILGIVGTAIWVLGAAAAVLGGFSDLFF
jgi:hypothetical protein